MVERAEMAWVIRGPWNGKLYGFESQKWRAEKVKERFKKLEVYTVVRQEPLDGLYEELTEDQESKEKANTEVRA